MGRLTDEAAIDIIARHAVNAKIDELDWGLYPEISQSDWDRVIDRARALLDAPTREEFETAYDRLETKAMQWSKDNPDMI